MKYKIFKLFYVNNMNFDLVSQLTELDLPDNLPNEFNSNGAAFDYLRKNKDTIGEGEFVILPFFKNKK